MAKGLVNDIFNVDIKPISCVFCTVVNDVGHKVCLQNAIVLFQFLEDRVVSPVIYTSIVSGIRRYHV